MTETLLTCSLCRESYTARTERDDYDVRGSSFDAVIEEDWECPDCGGHPIDCTCGACPREKSAVNIATGERKTYTPREYEAAAERGWKCGCGTCFDCMVAISEAVRQ